ncbi:MAG: hypothetical protein GX605_12335 [Chloroflexi bacterium]|nr:hypothetical protein [Chloroflexota bacterium]
MRRQALLLVTALMLLLAFALPVLADGTFGAEGYNWEDPVLMIAGTRVQVDILSDVPDGETVSRTTRVWVFVPRDVEVELIDDGGMWVNVIAVGRYAFGSDPVPFKVQVFKPRTDQASTFPVVVTVFAGQETTAVSGMSGEQIRVDATVPAP